MHKISMILSTSILTLILEETLENLRKKISKKSDKNQKSDPHKTITITFKT